MKAKIFRILSLVLCLAMALTLFTACGKGNESETTTLEETTEPIEQIAVLDTVKLTWGGSTKTYTVGKELTLDENGRISEFLDSKETVRCTYNADGILTEVTSTNNSSNKVATETWSYENKLPVSCKYTSNNYRSSRDTTYSVVTDDSGKILERTENNTYTDSDDGSKSSDTTKYEYTYDESGKIVSLTYSKNGKIDHTSNITYDENGNITVYSSKGSELGEYLRFELTYKMVDKGTYNIEGQDSYTKFLNWDLFYTYFI